MTLNELVQRAHANSKEKGFWDDENWNVGEKLALIHSEVSEALEDARDFPDHLGTWFDGGSLGGKPTGFASELADIVIRVGDLCGKLGIDLDKVVTSKMLYNSTRPRKHGKAF